MIVVSNTSPLTNLAAIGQFDLLSQLYGEVQIATGVLEELNVRGRRWPGYDETSRASWIKQHVVHNQDLIAVLLRDLDRGEAETLALAIELDADLVLMDERDGRRFAQRLGLRPVGVVGILLEAKKAGLLNRVRPCLEALRHDAGFYVSDGLCELALELAGE
jgi:predicted nucleic acid-binding protein